MFEKGLKPPLRRYLVSHRLHTVREVADAAMAQELEGQKAKEAAAKTASQVMGRGKASGPLLRHLRVDNSRRGPSQEEPTSPDLRAIAITVGSMGLRPMTVVHRPRGEPVGAVELQEDEGLDRVVGSTHSISGDCNISRGLGSKAPSSRSLGSSTRLSSRVSIDSSSSIRSVSSNRHSPDSKLSRTGRRDSFRQYMARPLPTQ